MLGRYEAQLLATCVRVVSKILLAGVDLVNKLRGSHGD